MTDDQRAQIVSLVISDLQQSGCNGHDAYSILAAAAAMVSHTNGGKEALLYFITLVCSMGLTNSAQVAAARKADGI